MGQWLTITGYVPYFDLKLYDEGFVLILPEAKTPDVLPEFQPQEKNLPGAEGF